MKRLSKLIMITGAALFLFAACANSSDGSKSSGKDSKPAQPEQPAGEGENGGGGGSGGSGGSGSGGNEDPAPIVLHHEESNFPKFEYDDISEPQTVVLGTPQTLDILTVTPASDGLHIKADYTGRNDTQYWRHIAFAVQDITDSSVWVASVQTDMMDIELDGSNLKPTEYVFPFTKAGCKYKVWIMHCGEAGDEWGGWKDEEKEGKYQDQTGFTATGGLGNVNVNSNYDGFLFLTPDPKLYLDRLTLELPGVLRDVEAKWDVHAEVDTDNRWSADDDHQRNELFPFTGDFITGLNKLDDDKFHFADQTKIFFNVSYWFKYKNVVYKQWVVNNDNRFFRDVNTTGSDHFPLIKIKSTTNYGGMKFVLEPIAKHVKEHLSGGGDVQEPWYEACDIYEGDNKIGSGEVKVRGNWTTSYGKKSLRIKFDEKQKMLGLNENKKFKNWVLLADWKDASQLRNAAALKLYHELFPGYASDCKLVEVEVNGSNLGVYLIAEQQEAKRLGLTEPEKKAKNTDIGYLLEFDSYYDTEKDNEKFTINHEAFGKLQNYAGTQVTIANSGYAIKSDITDKAQHDFIADYMNKLWEICYQAAYKNKYYKFKDDYSLEEYFPEGSDDENCQGCIEQIIDLGSLADMYLFCELTCDPDLYYSSFFMNVDFGQGKDKKLYFNAPWDFDSTMGNKRFCLGYGGDGFNGTSITDMYAGIGQPDVNGNGANYANPWMVIFINQGWFKNIVKDRWGQANANNHYVLQNVKDFIDDNSKNSQQPVYDFTRALWGNPGDNGELCQDSSDAAKTSQQASAMYLKTWLSTRFSYVENFISRLQ